MPLQRQPIILTNHLTFDTMKLWHKLLFILWIFSETPVHAQGIKPAFIPNHGQWNPAILFMMPIEHGFMAIEHKALRFVFWDDKTWEKMVAHPHGVTKPRPTELPCYNYKIVFENAQEPIFLPSEPESYYQNFFLGNDTSSWKGKVPAYRKLILKELWPGIDFELSLHEKGLKTDFWIHSGNLNLIQLKYEGITPTIGSMGNLTFEALGKKWNEYIPFGEIRKKNGHQKIPLNYILNGQNISFQVDQEWKEEDVTRVDPLLIFSTYSGATVDNFGFTATYDSKGSLIAGGIASWPTTVANGRYPATPGAFQVNFGGGNTSGWEYFPCDISISKYTPDGDSLIYATYLGGNASEFPHSIVVDPYDQLIVFGSTTSVDFPVKSGSIDTTHHGGYDIILTKFTSNGSALVGSTYLGGKNDDGFKEGGPLKFNYADEFRGEVDVDEKGNIYIASCTQSDDFPVSTFSPQNKHQGKIDALLMKIDSQITHIKWSTFWGGKEDDAFYSIEVSPNDSIITAGGGTSSDSLFTDSNAWQKKYAGGRADGYIIRMSNDSLNLLQATYHGTSLYNQIYFIEQDVKGRIYCTGQTAGNWPTRGTGIFNSDPGSGQFITRFNAELSDVEKSICFGSGSGKPDVNPSAFMVDYCENVYFSGWGSDVAVPGDNVGSTSGLKITGNAIQTTTDGQDFYLTVFAKNLSSRLYATYFGSNGQPNESGDHVDGGTSRFDPKGVVYQSVCSSCPMNNQGQISNFPTSAGAFSTNNPSPRCSNASFKIDFQISSAVIADFTVGPSAGCFPTPFSIINKSSGKDYYWDFGDGNTSRQQFPSHNYAKEGSYTIRLIVTDSNSCNVSDTAYRQVTFLNIPNAKYSYSIDPCQRTLSVKNTALKAVNSYWNWGDSTYSYADQIIHQYIKPGIYKIVHVNGAGFPCSDTVEFTITIPDIQPPVAQIQASPLKGCPPFQVQLNSVGTSGMKVYWEISTFPTDTQNSITLNITKKGKYKVILTVKDPYGCGLEDKDTIELEAFDETKALFEPEIDLCEQTVTFKDKSEGAFSWLWNFGDASPEDTTQNPTHRYAQSGTYTVTLSINRGQNCQQTFTLPVPFLIYNNDSFLLPNVFTPNGDGLNDCFQAAPVNPHCLIFQIWIYNRWGELVFRSEDPLFCWNGNAINGGNCADGTYFYILEMIPNKKEKVTMKGTVTLLGN